MNEEKNAMNSPVCMITGGSSGIGLAVARKFASQGFRIAICGRRKEKLKEAAAQIELAHQNAAGNSASLKSSICCFAQAVDLTDVEQAKVFATRVLHEFDGVDLLINNAAAAPLAPFESITERDFETTLDINLRSLFYITQIIWRDWLEKAARKEEPRHNTLKTIINISSLAAIDPFPNFSIYGASKAWLDLMTHALAIEGEPHRIRACSVRPGAVETPLLRSLFPEFPADQCASPETVANFVWNCVANPDDFPSGTAFTLS